MHRSHALWLGIPLMFIVAFALIQAWAPGRISGAVFLVVLVSALVVIFVLRFRRTFRD
ncbi:MAG: hypothetical protein OXR67_06195 [Chloroflexota bacterium]|nr:hypothetical protein [Chloroflexota bacterium]